MTESIAICEVRSCPPVLWDNVEAIMQPSAKAYLIFDDTVLDKYSSSRIELTRRHYSGNEH